MAGGGIPQRILVLGNSGSGKSTLARELGARLDLPVVHMDQLYWKPGWQPRTDAELIAMLEAAQAQPRWIIDGNYSRTLAQRLELADAVIFLDLPVAICMLGALGRVARNYGRSRPDMQDGCPERLDLGFLGWIWGYRRRSRPHVLELIEDARRRGVAVYRAGSRRETARILAQLCNGMSRTLTQTDECKQTHG